MGWQRWVELWWRGALARDEAKWRRGWVVERVTKVEMIFLQQWRVRVGRSKEGSLRWWCGFNASVSVREGEARGQRVVRRWSGGSELILTQWKGSVTRRGGMKTSAKGEATLGRWKGGDDTSWADVNLTRPKNKEIPYGRFSWYKWTVKI
jgi:hypothetical protein